MIMAKTYKELMASLARRGMGSASDLAASAVDMVSDIPAQAAGRMETAATNMTSKAQVVATTIEAKIMLEDRLMDDMDDEVFAYQLTQDENLRKTMHLLTQQILNPDPVVSASSAPQRPNGSFLNIGAGISTFWEEVQKKTPIEIEDAARIERILMDIDAGLDPDMAPDTRKLFLKDAGLTTEQLEELVPLSEYIIYETKMMDQVKEEVQEDLGLNTGRTLSEGEQQVVDSLARDDVYTGNTRQANKPHVRKGYVMGNFEGEDVTIKGSWSGHTFTDEELDKLFAGEAIDVTYTKKNGTVSHVQGKLEMQTYNGKEFLGFKPDFSKRNDTSQAETGNVSQSGPSGDGWEPAGGNPFDPSTEFPDESGNVSQQDLYAMFDDAPYPEPPAEDESRNVSQQDLYAMFDDMPGSGEPTYEETYGISAQDMYTMFSNGDGHIPDPETWTDAPMDDREWAQIMELSGAEENYQAMMGASIEENMEMLWELEMQEKEREAQRELPPADLPFEPESFQIRDEDLAFAAEMAQQDYPADFGIRDTDLAFAEQYAQEDPAFGIRDEDLAFAEEMARQGL